MEIEVIVIKNGERILVGGMHTLQERTAGHCAVYRSSPNMEAVEALSEIELSALSMFVTSMTAWPRVDEAIKANLEHQANLARREADDEAAPTPA